MTQLLIAVSVFLLSHMIPALPRLRAGLIARLGRTGYLVAYSALSLAVIAWVAVAYRQAAYVPVWDYDPILNWAPFLVMPAACVLLVGSLRRSNPLSVSLRRPRSGAFDPEAPGLLAVTRHPLPWAFALWAGAHMVPNGDAASLILFGLLLVLAIGGAVGLDAKHRRTLGTTEWRRLAANTSLWPFAAVLRGRAPLRLDWRDGLGGLALYGAILLMHAPVIGVPPFPPGLW